MTVYVIFINNVSSLGFLFLSHYLSCYKIILLFDFTLFSCDSVLAYLAVLELFPSLPSYRAGVAQSI
jgi:hypothetical protein